MKPNYSQLQVKKIFVGGLKNAGITVDDLEDYFGKFGRIKEAIVMEKDGESRGFGFVSFDDFDPVDKLMRKCIEWRNESQG